jgi:TolB-like protein/DNA-binding winged helix-turn-helix (wHTH) protein
LEYPTRSKVCPRITSARRGGDSVFGIVPMNQAPQSSAAPPSTHLNHAVFVGDWLIEPELNSIQRNGEKAHLEPKAMEVLVCLIQAEGSVISKEELIRQVWRDTFVTDDVLKVSIWQLRKAFHDDSKHPKVIETIPKSGYRLLLPVRGVKGVEVPVFHSPILALIGASVLVLVVVAAWVRYKHPQTGGLGVTTASIAVLPFADLSPNHDQEYLSEGLAEEILNDLAKIPNLKVAARTSAFQFKGKSEDSRVIGLKLNAANFLEGSVRKDISRVRITVQLIKADDGFHLWSESYDRDLKDIFAVEDDIAKAVTSALQVKLRTGKPIAAPPPGTTDPESYEAFLHARYFSHMFDQGSAIKALDHANRAIQLNPNYAPAFALRATIILQSGGMVWVNPSEAAEKARRDTERAIALDPNLADAYQILSRIQSEVELNCREAKISLERARELAPGDAENLGQGAMLATCQGRQEEAIGLRKQELLLDPLQPLEYMNLAQDLRDLGRHEEALVALGKAFDLNPKEGMAHEIRGEVYLAQGRLQEALAEMDKEPEDIFRDLGRALAYHALGQSQESDSALAKLISEHQGDAAYQIAQAYGYRGEVDQAFAWLNRAYKQSDPGLMWVKTDLKFKSLHRDPRFAQLLKSLNLPE